MNQRGDHMKMNFEYFQIQKWMLQTVRAEKLDKINWVICPVSMFPSWVMVFKLSKKVHFCNFVLTSARNLSLLKQFTYMPTGRLRYVLSENGIAYYTMAYCFGDIRVSSRRISAESASFLYFNS